MTKLNKVLLAKHLKKLK